MKKQLITLVFLAALPAFSFAQTADEIVDKHIAALGGADKVAAVKTMDMEQAISVMGQELTSKTVFVVGKSMRNDVSVMGQQITNVFDGDQGWMINPMAGSSGVQDYPAEALKGAKSAEEPPMFQLAYAKANKMPYELVGKETYKGKDVYNLKMTRPEGVYNYYVDVTNYQLLGYKGTSPQGEASVSYSDYKTVDGLSIPYASEGTVPNVPAPITTKTTKVTINNPVDPAIFNKPKSN